MAASRPLEGQKALVTGARSGIGEAIARAMAAAGAAVVVNYHAKADAALAIVDDLTRDGGTAMAVGADVSKEDDVRAMFTRMLEAWAPSTSWSTTPGCKRTRRSPR